MIFTRRFGALAARPQFPDAPELQRELDLELPDQSHDEETNDRKVAVESAA
jgi:hypothetical protein